MTGTAAPEHPGGSERDGPEPLDRLDRQLIQLVQDEFPLVPRVWAAIGTRVGLGWEETFSRVKRLQEQGFIRSIAPVLESSKIAQRASTLVGVSVPPEKIREVAAVITAYPGVSHNYERRHAFNIWFTLSGPDRDSLDRILAEIRAKTGLGRDKFLDLPILRKFKIDVRYRLDRPAGGA